MRGLTVQCYVLSYFFLSCAFENDLSLLSLLLCFEILLEGRHNDDTTASSRTVSVMARVTCTLSAHYVQFSPAPPEPLEKSAFIPEMAYDHRNSLLCNPEMKLSILIDDFVNISSPHYYKTCKISLL